MLDYIRNSFKRKIARRITREYPLKTDIFTIPDYGGINFVNWENPLVKEKEISEQQIGFFKRFIKEGDFVIDIGANIGHMSVIMALIAGRSGLTLAFDPNPFVFKVLERNATLNPDQTNLQAFNVAITDADGTFYYNSSEASFNNGGISKEKDNKHGKYSLSHKIKGINLENFLDNRYPEMISKLSLVKIDTEGYDKEIIRSISSLLNQYKPAVISECFGKSSEIERFEHFDLLKSKGYSLSYFSEFSTEAEIVSINKKEDMLKWKHFDFYSIKE